MLGVLVTVSAPAAGSVLTLAVDGAEADVWDSGVGAA